MFFRSILLSLFGALVLSGCSVTFGGGDTMKSKVEERLDSKRSMIYGYIDMKDAEPKLDWVLLKKLKMGAGSTKHWMRVHKGTFYLENLESGSYQITDFGGIYRGAFCRGGFYCSYPAEYLIPRQSKMYRVKIDKPGLYFLGSSKYTLHESTSLFVADTFSLDPEDNPTAKEVLQGILPKMKKTEWEGILTQSIGEMK